MRVSIALCVVLALAGVATADWVFYDGTVLGAGVSLRYDDDDGDLTNGIDYPGGWCGFNLSPLADLSVYTDIVVQFAPRVQDAEMKIASWGPVQQWVEIDLPDVPCDGTQYTTDVSGSAGWALITGTGEFQFGDWSSGPATPFTLEYLALLGGAVPGDADGDGVVDLTDLGILATNWGRTDVTVGAGEGDFDDSGTVDLSDLGILATNWGTGTQAVPEPATMSLLGLGALALIRRRK